MATITFDLDALEAEAHSDEPAVEFTLGGTTFTLPAIGDLDYRILLEGETDASGNPTYAEMRRLLSLGLGEQWAAFDANALSTRALVVIFEKWNSAISVDPGESDASTRS